MSKIQLISDFKFLPFILNMLETLLRGIPQKSRAQIVFDCACLSIEENPEQGKEELITTEKATTETLTDMAS